MRRIGADRLLVEVARLIERALFEGKELAPPAVVPIEGIDERGGTRRGGGGAGVAPPGRRVGAVVAASRSCRAKISSSAPSSFSFATVWPIATSTRRDVSRTRGPTCW